MFGVIGARQVLAREEYRWIAPVSAFLSNAPIVDLGRWPKSYPRSILETRRIPGRRITLTPDYLAVRSGDVRARSRWAAAEAKGTANDLGIPPDKACPPSWRMQSHNLEVAVNGASVVLERHLVVATRVNPGGPLPADRRIQIRAWNSDYVRRSNPPEEAAVEIAAAHLFGLCLSLGLRSNALALSRAVEVRNTARQTTDARGKDSEARRLAALADSELRNQFAVETISADDSGAGFQSFRTPSGSIDVNLAPPVVTLLRQLRTSRFPDAVEALRIADQRLDASGAEIASRDETTDEWICGVKVQFAS
jgi:hypothetical protein